MISRKFAGKQERRRKKRRKKKEEKGKRSWPRETENVRKESKNSQD